jgi:5,10-methylenetetrahydromethanopterin reductase
MPPDVSVAFDGLEPPDVVRATARDAEAAGARSLWFAAHLFNREPIATVACALAATSRIKVALMALSPYTVHPVYAAMAAATLDEWFPGRVELCLGVGAPRDLEAAGVATPHPERTLRESLAIVRALLAGETVTHEGTQFHVQGRRLATGARTVPLILAASGPRMLALAGRAADGVLISAATSPEFIGWTLEQVSAGEQSGARRVRRIALVLVAMDVLPDRAHARLRRRLGFILRGGHHAPNLRLAGTTLDQAAVSDAYAQEDWARVDALVTDDVVRRHAASGTPVDVREALRRYRAIGLDEIVFSGVAGRTDLAAILDVAQGV